MCLKNELIKLLGVPLSVECCNVLSLSLDLTRPHDQRVIWVFGWEHLILCHHPAKSGVHMRCGSGDIKIPANTGFFTANARYLLLYVSLLLPFLFSVKYMACHVPKVSQTTSQGIIFMETSISVPMK